MVMKQSSKFNGTSLNKSEVTSLEDLRVIWMDSSESKRLFQKLPALKSEMEKALAHDVSDLELRLISLVKGDLYFSVSPFFFKRCLFYLCYLAAWYLN